MATEQDHQQGTHPHDDQQSHGGRQYLRFAAMILTAMVVMYGVMYLGTYAWGHVQWSESRMFMTLTMGGTMGLVMLAWMLHMYRSTALNLTIVAVSLLLIAGGVFLDRSQTTVQDDSFMSGMIPHHSLAITRSERAELSDLRVCELAVAISEAQRREIDEMHWLIDDIKANGPATTSADAEARPIPEFEVDVVRECPGS